MRALVPAPAGAASVIASLARGALRATVGHDRRHALAALTDGFKVPPSYSVRVVRTYEA